MAKQQTQMKTKTTIHSKPKPLFVRVLY